MNDRRGRSAASFCIAPISVLVLVLMYCTSAICAEPSETGRKQGLLHALAFSPDGSLLAAGGESICIYDVKSGKLLKRWSPPPMTRTMGFLPGAKSILVEAGDGGAIRFHNVVDERPVRELKLHAGRVRYLASSPNGKLAASTAVVLVHERPHTSELRVWNTESGEIVGSIDLEVGAFFGPVFAPDGKSLLIPQAKRVPGDYEEIAASVEHYGIPEWKHLRSIATPGYVMSAAFARNGKDVMLGGVAFHEGRSSGPGKIWTASLGHGDVSEVYTEPGSKINHVFSIGTQQQLIFGTSTEPEFDRRGRAIDRRGQAALSRQAKVVRSSLVTGKEVWASTSEDDRDEVQAIAVSPNGELVAWCTFGTILILDAERGRLLRGIGVAE